MGSATGTSKGHAKSIRWVPYGGEAYREAESKNAQRASAATRSASGVQTKALLAGLRFDHTNNSETNNFLKFDQG